METNDTSVTEHELENLLNQVTSEWVKGSIKTNGEWTSRIKILLGDLGRTLGYQICSNGCKGRFESEWLYDLVWYKELEGKLEKIALVVESEWSLNLKDVKYDFEKLLLSNSDLRLMICQAWPNQRDEYIKYFNDAVECYTQLKKGDKFVIAIFENESDYFIFEPIIKK